MTKRIFLALLATLFVADVSAEPVEYPTNKDGSTITGVLTAGFDPLDSAGRGPVVPFPFNLFFLDLDTFAITDFTLNLPVEDPTDFSDPAVALGAIDGFSTTERWTVSFLDQDRNPGSIDPASVVPGQSVRLFEVTTTQLLAVTGIVRELTPGVDYVTTVAPGGVLAIIPLKPLKELTSYMGVLTNDITDTRGNNATPDTTYHLTQREESWVDENGQSTYPLVADDLAQTLATIQPVTASMEAAAASAGVVREDIIMAWTAQTQAVTPVLKQLRSIAKPAPTVVGPSGLNTGAVGGMGIADIYAGIITLPYYLGVPSAENPTAPLTGFWTAEPGAYVPPFDMMLPDKTSTNVTVANPFPIKTGDQTVPLLVTAPNANSGQAKPAAGWPVVIFGHGITRSRADALAMADAAAAVGFAVVAMDFPMHGITPEDPLLAPLYVGNGPFKDIANERTFDVDYINNSTGLPHGPGESDAADPSGTHFLNLTSLLTTRDNMRQGSADLSVLAASLPFMSIDGDTLPDLDASTVIYVGHSIGAILGTPFVALEPTVTNAFLSAGMGGVARGFEASATFRPRIRAGLAAAGVMPGTSDYEFFFTVLQTVLDSADPVNWATEAAMNNNVVVHEIIGDTVVPNFVSTAPLSGTEPMIATMGLASYNSTQSDPNGVDLAGRFVPPASHGSLLDPSSSPAATVEMQKQLASFLLSKGTAVVVEDAATMVPVSAEGEAELNQPEKAPPAANKLKLKIKK
jgi:pimeloyl-ACP methyl ester carboxylesterase